MHGVCAGHPWAWSHGPGSRATSSPSFQGVELTHTAEPAWRLMPRPCLHGWEGGKWPEFPFLQRHFLTCSCTFTRNKILMANHFSASSIQNISEILARIWACPRTASLLGASFLLHVAPGKHEDPSCPPWFLETKWFSPLWVRMDTFTLELGGGDEQH